MEKTESQKQLEKDAAIGRLVRSMLVSGNYIPVERCVIKASVVAELDTLGSDGWCPIETYPKYSVPEGAESYWGPSVLVRCAPTTIFGNDGKVYQIPETYYIAALEADMWLGRCYEDGIAMSELHSVPTHWMPFTKKV